MLKSHAALALQVIKNYKQGSPGNKAAMLCNRLSKPNDWQDRPFTFKTLTSGSNTELPVLYTRAKLSLRDIASEQEKDYHNRAVRSYSQSGKS